MITQFTIEIKRFFSSLTGYIVIVSFLIINGLVIWGFSGPLNILDGGYATLEPFFMIAPWIFLFLIPAITMRTFSDEKKSGTLDLLLTRPISELQLILAKYLGALFLVLLSIIPCLVYFISVWLLGAEPGNMDTGATWGSFIGLFLLAAVYAAIGIFSSSITDNVVISFLLSATISLFIFKGFNAIAQFNPFGNINNLIYNLGIEEHYQAISKGVVDSRDIIYFLSVIFLFILFTKFRLLNNR